MMQTMIVLRKERKKHERNLHASGNEIWRKESAIKSNRGINGTIIRDMSFFFR
jgi:hypothetical protein